MPVIGTVTALSRADLGTAGSYLRAAGAGELELADLVAVAVAAGGEVAADAGLDALLPAGAAEVVKAAQQTGKAGQVAHAVAKVGQATVRIALVGVGDRSPGELRRAGGELGRLLRQGDRAVSSVVAGQPDDQIRAFAEGVLLGSYRYSEKSEAGIDHARVWSGGSRGVPPFGYAQLRLLVPGSGKPQESPSTGRTGRGTGSAAAIDEAVIFATATALARDLTNAPSVRKCPRWLADVSSKIAAENGLACRVWTEQELASAGFGGLMAVGSGSDRPPRLIELSYSPPAARRHVVLVGKGITFDSGGLSLKPNDGMKAMKTDMAGGAAVIAVMSALAALGVSARVSGLVPAAENMPSGSAYRPGDIVTQYGGRTVEVLNTDAEGRLVLADAIAYADAALDPGVVVDIATLTGAARIALGTGIGALYSTDDGVAGALLAAGQATGERLWRMPLPADYLDALDSPVADLAHLARSGAAGEKAGSIAAALFLREFTGGRPWAHLDVAGAARASSDDGEITKGGTGFGTRLLLNWLSGI